MKKLLAFILSVLTVASLCVFTVGAGKAAEETGELYASVLSFDNFKLNENITGIDSEDATINTVTEAYTLSFDEYHVFHLEISGEGLYEVTVDASSVDLSERKAQYIVIDANGYRGERSDVSKLDVTPMLTGGDGESADYIEYNGVGYFKLSEPMDVKGLAIGTLVPDYSWTLSEIFFCENEYSAKFIVDNNVLPSKAGQKDLYLEESGEYTAIDIDRVTYEELPHHYESCKWANIAVDENDRLYIATDGCRTVGHGDIVEYAIMATSEDGGKTWSKPKNLFNTMHGSSPAILYLGDGTLISHVGTSDGTVYLKGASQQDVFMANWKGGLRKPEENVGGTWDSDGYPVGGFYGAYLEALTYVNDHTPEQLKKTAYIVTSHDYGETWDDVLYTLEGTEGVDYSSEMKQLITDYKLRDVSQQATCPIDFGGHGPRLLSDGTIMYIGYEPVPDKAPAREAAVYVSNDQGQTWDYRGYVPTNSWYGPGNFFEPDVCETKDGALLCSFRSHVEYNSFSYDMGRTWTTPAQTEIEGYPSGLLTLDNGDIVVTTNWRFGSPKIFAYVSEDGGRTWSTKADFHRTFAQSDNFSTDMGYPNSVQLSDGTIVTVYYSAGTTTCIQTTNWKYRLFDIKPNTWTKNPTGWYYFDENCEVATSQWIADATGLCYVDADGYLVTGRSIKYNRKYYLVDDAGHKVTKTGWQKSGGKWYYVLADGTLKTDGWMKDSKGWCFLLSSGAMATNRSVKDTKGYCLVDASGYWCTKTGWQKAGDDWYYVLSGGYLKTLGWMKDSKGWCYLDTDGRMKTNTILEDSKGWCAIDGSGYWVTKQGWKQIGNDWVYVQKGGYLKTEGWMNDTKGWCYLGKDGAMLKSMAVKDSKGWALLTSEGYWQSTPDEYLVPSFYGRSDIPKGLYKVNSSGYIDLSSSK